MSRDFRGLTAWRKADDLAVEVYRTTSIYFPREELYGLTTQLRRSAVSVAANLAEGSGRQSEQEFRRFLYISRGSLAEVEYYLHLAARLEFLPPPAFAGINRQRDEVGKLLVGLIRSVSKQITARETKP